MKSLPAILRRQRRRPPRDAERFQKFEARLPFLEFREGYRWDVLAVPTLDLAQYSLKNKPRPDDERFQEAQWVKN